jgi:hypothetical protein
MVPRFLTKFGEELSDPFGRSCNLSTSRIDRATFVFDAGRSTVVPVMGPWGRDIEA